MAVALAVAGIAAIPVAFAQDNAETGQPAQSQDMQEMMQGMQGDGMGMMPMMRMMSQMNEMMGNCNKMMQAMMSDMDMPSEEGEQPTTEN
ncbi:hypothetical protein [Chelativorans intermedius]|uniref:DUF4175 domain-containing protein n=1 Tax=Chelativorans intermedius TaxID=515947 RepID=A0ABV6DBG6_9HYPH|nr:hypothetical protein [Chelativorans intermedius]MCT9000281.1 hypothetical protein [Chelativorans intermedius]